MKEDLELKQFRDLMPAPDRWEEGFGLKAMIGGLFVGLIMTPASMYMQLVVGADIGPAAQWVTIILFIEVARRPGAGLGGGGRRDVRGDLLDFRAVALVHALDLSRI